MTIMKTSILASCIALLACVLPAAAQTDASGTSCGCDDVRELQARYCAARQAKGEYDNLIAAMESRERDGKLETMTLANQAEVEQCVDNAISAMLAAFKDRVGYDASGNNRAVTDKNCNVNIMRAPSSCMREVLTTHEEWHVRQCNYWRDATLKGDYIPRWLADMLEWRAISGQTLVSYMLEERTGYAIEQQALMNRLKDLYDRCPRKTPPDQPPPKRKYSIAPCPNVRTSDYPPTGSGKECKRR